ncbi:MAG: phage major capsid protein [Ruminococcus sp.]|nr:phage major capsid protein [Ruminococcus sp.]
MYKDTSCIIVNDDGLNWLDTLKDNDGNYLLGYNPIEPKQMQLSVGANLIPVYNVPNSVMPSNDTQYPIIIGDLKEAIKYWDRQQITIDVSNTATVGNYNAFGQNLTIFRGLLRADVTLMDTQAIVYGYIDSSTS